MNARTDSLGASRSIARGRVADYAELTKPRITLMVVITALVGFKMSAMTMGGQVVTASGAAYGSMLLLLNALIGVGLVAAGASALNQLMERDIDRRMRRTANRPLPAGRLAPEQALVFGSALVVGGVVWLAAAVNLLTAGLAAFTAASYLLLYTPLKQHTSLSTLVGAVPGAMPPVLGWTAASGSIGGGAWALFAILFVWQLPHFLAIAWLYRDDYARGGLPMLPVIDADGHLTSRHIAVTSACLLPISLAPTLLGLTGMVYFAGAALLGVVMLGLGIRLAGTRLATHARQLFLASLVYLPVLLALMVADRVVT
jgi:protoheme IX farnesyltransferase